MKTKNYLIVLLIIALPASLIAQINKNDLFKNGDIKDISGNSINAHGAGILKYRRTYYLYGEIKKGTTWLVPGQKWEDYRVPAGGISCYSSKDLKHWKNEAIVLHTTPGSLQTDLDTGKVIERPKVIYNKKTKSFVMWMHVDNDLYSLAHAGVAISKSPTGPFKYIESKRPNNNDCRDMSVFQDDDGKAYLIYSSDNNLTMHICLLADDYLSTTTNEILILINQHREAPAMFKCKNKYYLITSLCTGWDANAALYATADSILGTWKMQLNPCIGKNAETTFGAQSAFVLPIDEKNSEYLFMADKWCKTDLSHSQYLWIPFEIMEGKISIKME